MKYSIWLLNHPFNNSKYALYLNAFQRSVSNLRSISDIKWVQGASVSELDLKRCIMRCRHGQESVLPGDLYFKAFKDNNTQIIQCDNTTCPSIEYKIIFFRSFSFFYVFKSCKSTKYLFAVVGQVMPKTQCTKFSSLFK